MINYFVSFLLSVSILWFTPTTLRLNSTAEELHIAPSSIVAKDVAQELDPHATDGGVRMARAAVVAPSSRYSGPGGQHLLIDIGDGGTFEFDVIGRWVVQ